MYEFDRESAQVTPGPVVVVTAYPMLATMTTSDPAGGEKLAVAAVPAVLPDRLTTAGVEPSSAMAT